MTRSHSQPTARLPVRGRTEHEPLIQDLQPDAPLSLSAWPTVQRHAPAENSMYRFGSSSCLSPGDYAISMARRERELEDAYDEQVANDLLHNFASHQIAQSDEMFDSDIIDYQSDCMHPSISTLSTTQGIFWQHDDHSTISSDQTMMTSYFIPTPASGTEQPPPNFQAHTIDDVALRNDSLMHMPTSMAGPGPQTDAAARMSRTHRPIRPKDAASMAGAPPDVTHVVDLGPKGRKRPLSPDRRAAARRVRSMRACARCHELKGKCDTERPCKPCKSRNKRSLDFPCMPELPQDRWLHLFTEELYGHLDLSPGGLMDKMPKRYPEDDTNKPFQLRLHQYFDAPELTIPVMRFRTSDERDLNKSVFPLQSNGRHLEVRQVDILSPPLIPGMTPDEYNKWSLGFRNILRAWVRTAEEDRDIDWASIFFREEHGKAFPRSVLRHVCSYLHQVEWGASNALKSALRTTVFAYMLGHSFYVPHEDIQDALRHTGQESRYTGEFMFVSPIHVDRFLKANMYPLFRSFFMSALKELQVLCAVNKHSKYQRDQILATMIVLLIVAGTQQSKAVEKARALRRRGQEVEPGRLRAQIVEIEEWIIDLMVQLWQYKFPSEVKWASDDPQDRLFAFRAQLFGLHHKFETSILGYDHLATLPTHIPEEIDELTFGANNIDRILWKFHQAVYATQPQTHQTDDSKPGSDTFDLRFMKS